MTTATLGHTLQRYTIARHWIDRQWHDSVQHKNSLNPASSEMIGATRSRREDDTREAAAPPFTSSTRWTRNVDQQMKGDPT